MQNNRITVESDINFEGKRDDDFSRATLGCSHLVYRVKFQTTLLRFIWNVERFEAHTGYLHLAIAQAYSLLVTQFCLFSNCVKVTPEMKISLVKKSLALACLLLVDFCSSEEFSIFRYKTNPDSFFIPLSKCYTKNNDTLDYCAEYNAVKVQGRNCFCDCDHKHATFSYQKPSWSCLRNEDARALFGKSVYLIMPLKVTLYKKPTGKVWNLTWGLVR